MEIWIGAAAALLLVAALVWRLRGRRADAKAEAASRSLDGLDTLAAWEPQATRLLSTGERLAYGVLVRALPDYIVFAQVPLARFIRVPTRHSYVEWLARVGQLSPDLLICDSSSQVVCAVDVRPPTGQVSERGRKRQERVQRVLKAAGIPLHVWVEGNLPSAEAARDMLFPKPATGELTSTMPPASVPQPSSGAAPAAPKPPAEKKLALPDSLELEPDEVIEMREPPPSTWFDNMESRPAPLPRSGTANRPAAPGTRPPPGKPPTR